MKRIILFYIPLLIIFGAAQCRKADAVTTVYTDTTTIIINPGHDSLKTFLALGDSYTIGQSVSSPERFPAQTAALLRGNYIKISDPKYIATTGWTTENLAGSISSQMPLGIYNVVTLLIGVNDQYQRHDTTGYRQRFTNLLETSISLADNKPSHVFVLSIPDYSVTPFAANYDTAFIRIQLDQFNAINKEVTAQKSCQYLDITGYTRYAKTDLSLLASDGLHPSGKRIRNMGISVSINDDYSFKITERFFNGFILFSFKHFIAGSILFL